MLIWSRITPLPIKAKSQIGFKSCRLETAFFMKLPDQGSYTFASSPQHAAEHCSTQFLPCLSRQRGTKEVGGGLAVTAGLGSSATATKTSSGPSDHVICSLPFIHPEVQRGSGTGEGSSLGLCMLEGCLPPVVWVYSGSSLLINSGRNPWVPPLKLITAARGNRSGLAASS